MAEVEVATVLPRELRLGVPATMPQARSYLFKQRSTRDSYNPGETIQINLPRLQRSYLTKESYLSFRLSGMYKPDIGNEQFDRLPADLLLDDCGAYGFFEKIEVFDYLGSTVLETISGIPQVMSLLFDMGMTIQKEGGFSNAAIGLGMQRVNLINAAYPAYGGDYLPVADPGVAGFGTGKAVVIQGGETIVSTGGSRRTGWQDNTYNAYEFFYHFSIPLPSFLGFLSNKDVPLHNGFTIVLTVADLNKPMTMHEYSSPIVNVKKTVTTDNEQSAGTITVGNQNITGYQVANVKDPLVFWWQLSDINMECQVLELGPVAESMLLSSTQGQPLIVHTKAMRHYVGTSKSGQSEFYLNLNLNVASLTNILWFMRQSDQETDIHLPSCGNRTRNALQRWHFQYGSTILPQTNGIEAMSTTIPTPKSGYTWATLSPTNWAYLDVYSEALKELFKSRPVNINASRIHYWNYTQDRAYSTTLDTTLPSIHNYTNTTYGPSRQFGKFAAGLNLELAPNKNGDVISGLNTNGMNTQIVGRFHPDYLGSTSYPYNTDVIIDAFAEYDAFINISPGIATTVSF